MARPTRRIATTPKGVREKIKNASQYNLNLIKEIEASYRSKLDPGAEAKLADEKSIYPEWRGFLAAYRGKYGRPSEHTEEAIRTTFADFGDVDKDFEEWWREGGRELFREDGQVPLVTVVDIDENWSGEKDYPKYITLRIPLTVPRDNIDTQIREILKQCHMGSLLYRHRHSDAKYKLHPRSMYRKTDFKRMLEVWKIVAENWEGKPEGEKMPWWQIGRDARLAEGVDPERDTIKRTAEESRRHLAKLASDLYDQALNVMYNAVRGEFPKDTVPKNVPGRTKRKIPIKKRPA